MLKIDQLIESYFKGKTTDEDKSLLLKYLRTSEKNKAYFKQKKYEWQNNNEETFSIKEWIAWQKIKVRITKHGNQKIYPRKLVSFYKVASIIGIIMLISILIGIPMLHHQKVIVSTNSGQSITIVLPDSSLVTLNSNSSLEYHPLSFLISRKINLEGEAFFDVRHNSPIAFRVERNDLMVKVTGTTFNINTYETSNRYRIVLEDGIVQVKSKTFLKKPIKLNPGEMLEINRETSQYNVKKVNTLLHTSWKEGVLYFYDSPLEDVIERIKTRYGVEIGINEEIINTFLVSTTIRDEPLEKVFDLLKKVLPIHIKESDDTFSIHLDKKRYELRMKKNQT